MKERPIGVQCLVPWSRGLDPDSSDGDPFGPVLDVPWVAGMVVRFRWRDLADGDQWNWNPIEAALAVCERADKFVHLMIGPGFYSPPSVFEDSDVQRERLPVPQGPLSEEPDPKHPIPLPWDGAYLAHWVDFVYELGARFESSSVLRCLSITGPNGHNGEVNLPHQAGGGMSAKAVENRWLARVAEATGKSGADLPEAMSGLLLPAWRTCIRAFRDAFPTTYSTVGVLYNPIPLKKTIRRMSKHGSDAEKAAVSGVQRRFKRRLLNSGVRLNPIRFGIQTNGMDDGEAGTNKHWAAIARRGRRGSLTGYQSRQANRLYDSGATSADKTETVRQMVDNVLSLRGAFFQVYRADLMAMDGRHQEFFRCHEGLADG